ncbi:MAG: 30S ribosomal protein S6 [Limibacillus sp.]|jgi:small subunit ribosomal protein S6
MAYYECVFIARQDISTQQVEGLSDEFAQIIETGGGKVTKRESWGLRNLAFKIKKNRKGHYMLFNIDGPSDAVLEMERNMRLNEDVLRYMTVRVEELEEGPSAMMQQKDRRDDRRGGPGGRRDDRGGDRGGDRRDDRRGDRGGDRGERRPREERAEQEGDSN